MNLILFSEGELDSPLPRSDERSVHILKVLGRASGEPFDAGVVDGKMGKARVVEVHPEAIVLSFDLTEEPPPLYPIELIVGLSRPQTMRRVLREATALGVSRMSFFASDRGERAYGESSLWKTDEYRRLLIDGAQQAFSTRLPVVARRSSLDECLSAPDPVGRSVALDNYEAAQSLEERLRSLPGENGRPACERLFVGSERGWSARERSLLRGAGVPLAHLGARVLRTDTACIAAVSITLSRTGLYDRLLADAEVRKHGIEDIG